MHTGVLNPRRPQWDTGIAQEGGASDEEDPSTEKGTKMFHTGCSKNVLATDRAPVTTSSGTPVHVLE